MVDYSDVSFWLETSGDDMAARPALRGSSTADVAIVGGGYTGLWTALYLLRDDPTLRVVVLEAETCGFGASGRNGAWCAPGLNISLPLLERRHGRDAARAVHSATFDAVHEVGRVTAEEGIDAGFHLGGALTVARGRHQQPSLRSHHDELVRYGFGDRYRLLDADELHDRVRIDDAFGAVHTAECAVIHPGRLVRGLARAVEQRGGVIHEGTRVSDVRPGPPMATVVAERGEVRARSVVVATEAYLSQLRRFHRAVLPVWSLIVLTEPLSDADWAEIGWANRECISSFRLSIDYLSRTEDGRILFGGRGAPYRFGSPIRREYDRHEPTHEMLRGFVRAWFPRLAGVRFTHAWGGPLGMNRDWMPSFRYEPRTGLGRVHGYIGHGVSTANLAGRTMRDLILERETDLTALPMANHKSRSWEPEPFRWIGVRFTQRGLAWVDARAARTGRPPSGRTPAEIIARH